MARSLLLAAALTAAFPSFALSQPRSGLDLAAIDRQVRPQDDLWKYANGKWLAATAIPPDRPGWDTFTALRDETQARLRPLIEGIGTSEPEGSEKRKIADLYASFMDEAAVEAAGIAGLKEEMARIHGLEDKAGLPALFAHLAKLEVRSPIELDIGADARDATTYIAYLGQGELGLPDRDYYLKDDPHFRATRTAYRDHIARLLSLAGEPSQHADAIVALETELARLQWTRVQNRDPIKTYNRRAVKELPALVSPSGDWPAFLAAADVAPGTNELVVYQPSYFEGLGKVLQQTPLETWRAYLTYQLLSAYAPMLNKAFVDEDFAFESHALRGVPQLLPRWRRGVTAVDKSLPFALGKLYVARYFPSANKARAEALISHLMAVYRQRLESLDWMGPDTRQQALDKLAAIRPKIGYPDKWRDYGSLEIRRGDLVGNIMRARRFSYDFWLAKLGHKVDRDEWFTAPQIVNAFYSAGRNEIVFPAAILQPPFFDGAADDAANYGGIGTVIGHEISHAFDDQGSRFDGAGNLRNWWTDHDRSRFEAKAAGLVAEYDAFSPLPGYTVNGRLTLGENIADNAGLAMAERAYRHSLAGPKALVIDGYSGEQRLFLAFAQIWRSKMRDAARIEQLKVDPHSPGQFRANGSARNLGAFADAFGVKPGDGMYLSPEQRISLW